MDRSLSTVGVRSLYRGGDSTAVERAVAGIAFIERGTRGINFILTAMVGATQHNTLISNPNPNPNPNPFPVH